MEKGGEGEVFVKGWWVGGRWVVELFGKLGGG